jgi:translation initiation factor 4E
MSSKIQPAKITNNKINFNKTKLSQRYSFWYRVYDVYFDKADIKKTIDKTEYVNQVKKIAEFDTIEDFWAIFQHLRKPDSSFEGIEFQLFKNPIKPIWDDENNIKGGSVSIKLNKDFTTIIWEEMVFAIIGDVLPKEIQEEINGIVVTRKSNYNTLEIWFKHYDEKTKKNIDSCIRDLIQIPPEVNLYFQKFF